MHTLSLGQATRGKSQFGVSTRNLVALPSGRDITFAHPEFVLNAEIALAAPSNVLALLLLARRRRTPRIVEICRSTVVFAIALRLAAASLGAL